MKKFTFFLVGINFITLAAHFSRAGMGLLSLVVLVLPFVLLYKKRISLQIIQAVMILAGIEWIRTTFNYIATRMDAGEPWFRLLIILSVVSMACFYTVYLLGCQSMKKNYE